MKITQLLTRKKTLRATTVRRQPMLGLPDDGDYEEMSEPNMKLSRALLIVLVLHVVAVGGVVAFNSIKTHQVSNSPETPLLASAPAKSAPPVAATGSDEAPALMPAVSNPAPRHDHVSAKAAATSMEGKSEHTKAAATPSGGPTDSGKTYTVTKGDNPVLIARKLKVPYDDLLALNHIEDPHKLQIGQKLAVPVKQVKAKRTDG